MKRYKLLNIMAVLLLVSTLSAQAQRRKKIKVSSGRIYTDGNMESRRVFSIGGTFHCLYLKKFVK